MKDSPCFAAGVGLISKKARALWSKIPARDSPRFAAGGDIFTGKVPCGDGKNTDE